MKRLKNPPIETASIEIRITPNAGADIRTLELVGKKLKVTHPTVKKVMQATATLDTKSKPETMVSTNTSNIGFIFENEKSSIDIRMDRFVFTLKGDYSSWEDFIKMAKKPWGIYKKQLAPKSIKRIGTQFINKLTVPANANITVADYWKTFPLLSPEIKADIGSFKMQLFLPDIYDGLKGWIHEQIAPDLKNKNFIFTLDINVYKDEDVSKNEKSLWAAFKILRNSKNKIFEASTTKKFRGDEHA